MLNGVDKFFLPDPDNDKDGSSRVAKLIPNMVTLGSMAAGLTAIQKAVNEQWHVAVILIVIAAVLDALDGALARLLNAASKFGAELDSLSDFLSFGVAPAMIMFLWVLQDAGKIGWMAAMIFVIASGLRLARYNTMLDQKDTAPEWGKKFFAGVPAPAGAGLMLLPIIWAFLIDEDMSDFAVATPLIGIWAMIVAGLMVSQIPTFSSKQIRVPTRSSMPVLLLVGLLIALLIQAPWLSLSIFLSVYMLSIPVSYRVYAKRKARAAGAENKES